MKLLHISDWHLGRSTFNEPRTPDHEVVIAEILDIARRAKPDLICHSGDLFDGVRPGYPELHRGIGALQELAVVAPVVVVGGNHDSPALLRLFNRLLGSKARIHFADKPRRPEDGGVLHFPGPNDEEIRLACLPFVHANRMVDTFEDPKTWMTTYSDRIRHIEAALGGGLAKDYDPERHVLLFAAHLHLDGARFSGSERAIHISDHYASRIEHVPQVSYAAFGHIHRPQPLPGGNVVGRYAGSPIPLDFGEIDEEKSVVLVEAQPGRPAEVTPVPLSGGRPLRRFAGTLEELQLEAPSLRNALCLVTIRSETPIPDLSARVREIVPDAVVLQVQEICDAHMVTALNAADANEAEEPGFAELFYEYLTKQGTKGAEANRVLETFGSLIQAVETEQLPRFPEEELLAVATPPAADGEGTGDAAAQPVETGVAEAD